MSEANLFCYANSVRFSPCDRGVPEDRSWPTAGLLPTRVRIGQVGRAAQVNANASSAAWSLSRLPPVANNCAVFASPSESVISSSILPRNLNK